ncbi:MAG: hypothetical protein DMG90_09970 [Acidobacteria bacterium]|nr:MAG: hypothetical protein DMG90_09970 [Acidobacteriota bacterium]
MSTETPLFKKGGGHMSHTFQISDEKYAKLVDYAEECQQTPEILFQEWIEGIIDIIEVQKVMFEEQKERKRTGEFSDDPLFQMAGSLSIDAPDLAHRLDEYLAEAYADNHAQEK